MVAVKEDTILSKRGTHASDELSDMHTDEVVVDEHADRSATSEKQAAADQSVSHSYFGDDVVARYA